jgi:hypothetical protein
MADIYEIKFAVRLEGELAYVRETYPDRSSTEYGPMPRDFAGPLIDERREYYEALRDKLAKDFAEQLPL